MTAKEIFLELLKEDGRPERQLIQYEALQMALGDPIGGYLHMGRRPGATITDLWGTVVDWPADAPGSMPIVTAENKVILPIGVTMCTHRISLLTAAMRLNGPHSAAMSENLPAMNGWSPGLWPPVFLNSATF